MSLLLLTPPFPEFVPLKVFISLSQETEDLHVAKPKAVS